MIILIQSMTHANEYYVYGGPLPEDYIGKIWKTYGNFWRAWKITDTSYTTKPHFEWNKEEAIQFLMEENDD